MRSVLKEPSSNPSLISLDLSERTAASEHMLSMYLDAHPSLRFLGLWKNAACGFSVFDPSSPKYRPGIEVSGHSSLDQFIVSLRSYRSREDFFKEIPPVLKDEYVSGGGFPMNRGNEDIIRSLVESIPPGNCLGDGRKRYRMKGCLQCLSLFLRDGFVSHIRPDLVRQLLFACHSILSQIEAMSSSQPLSDLRQAAADIVSMCECM